MRFAAGLAAAVFAYVAVGRLIGYSPSALRLNTPRRRRAKKFSRQTWLAQAGAGVTVSQFWATSALAGTAAFAVVYALTGAVAVALLPGLAVGALPRAYFAREHRRRARSVTEAWPDALRNLIASLSAGLSLHQALVALGSSGPPAMRAVFSRYGRLAATLDQRAALEVIRSELADPVSDRVIEVLILATEQGASVVTDILSDLARAATADLALAERIETAQLEQRLNARAVFVLPYFILIVLCVQGRDFRAFYQSGGGVIVVALGAAMSLGGMAIISRLSRMPAEERLFAPEGEAGR